MVFRKDLWQYIDKSYVLDITRSLIEIPSFKGLLRQETAVAEYLNKIFLENDIHSELIEVENGRCNIIAKLQGDSNGKNLLLNGHLDTVPPYDMVNPFKTQIIGNNLYGRGAVDMKGSVAGMVSAMIAIKKMNLNFSGTITFSGVIDEEEKSLGTIYFIENDLNEYDGAIVGEPTDLKLCIAHRGLRWIEIAIIGKTVHGGSQAEGLNAISLAGEFIPFIEKRMKEYILQSEHEIIGRGSFNIGTIGGGTQPSTVAGNCIIRFDRRWLPTENLQIILNQVESVVKDFSLMHPEYKIIHTSMAENIMPGNYSHESMNTDKNSKIVRSVSKAIKICTEREADITFFPAWSDGGLLQHFKGIPTVVIGPGKLISAHSADENIEIESLFKGVEVYFQSITSFLSEDN